jgi:hypothetical protein
MAIYPFTGVRNLVEGMSGVWCQGGLVADTYVSWRWLWGYVHGKLSFDYTLVFALQIRKITEIPSNSTWQSLGTVHALNFTTFDKQPWLTIDFHSLSVKDSGNFDQPSISTSSFQVAKTGTSPHRLLWQSQPVLWCGYWKMAPPKAREFTSY